MVASLAEGLTLAQASDLPSQDLLDALFGGAMAAPVFKIKASLCLGPLTQASPDAFRLHCTRLMRANAGLTRDSAGAHCCTQGPPKASGPTDTPVAFPAKHQKDPHASGFQ